MTDKQRTFLANEFGLNESQLYNLTPLHLWKLREDCIEIECDEAEINIDSNTERGKSAAGVVDIISSVLPKEWKRKTPQEVETMYINKSLPEFIFTPGNVAVAV